nr:nucleoporin nup211 [Parasteatoda tepidariorum]
MEKLTASSRSVDTTDLSIKFNKNEKIISKFVSTLKEIHTIISRDHDFEASTKLFINEEFDLDSVELKLSETLSNMRTTVNRYHKQIEENNSKLLSLKEQNLVQQRTIEFLEDERHNAQQLNLKLSSQFESLNQKMQDLMVDIKTGERSGQSNYLDGVVRSLREQIESHNSERVRLLSVQEELYSELQIEKEEKRVLKQKELSLTLEVEKYTRKSADMEANLDTIKDELLEAQKNLKSVVLDKELLEQEKVKFSGILSGLDNQILEMKKQIANLQDEERSVRASLTAMQSTNENLSCEKADLAKSLNEVNKLKSTSEILSFFL